MSIQMPQEVRFIIERLEAAGFEAFAVGGCIRDAVLGRVPADWDITTSAMPEQVKSLFSHTIDTGIQHGTVTVMIDHAGYEVTTYRIDGEYEDARHPKEVSFTSDLIEDLKRRDFTINAMAYNERAGLVDAFEGISDLEHRIIRCVGEAKERFSEDALRMLRAVRFSAQLGFSIEEHTREAISELAGSLSKISAERIRTELVKLLVSDHPDYLRIAFETGITAVVLPEFDLCMHQVQNHPYHMDTVGEHTLKSLFNVPKDPVLRLTMLFHDFGKPACFLEDEKGISHFYGHQEVGSRMAAGIMRRLKFDNDTTDKVKKLVAEHDRNIINRPNDVRRAVSKIGKELFPYYLQVRRADILAQNPQMQTERLKALEELEELYEQVIAQGEAVCVRDLSVNGRDLIREGIPQGKRIGEVLNALLEICLEEPEKNTKEQLLEIVRLEYVNR
ncbi:MAG: CCA tRNA nucleotidyltransferase [Lachnospiraceae bacterium]